MKICRKCGCPIKPGHKWHLAAVRFLWWTRRKPEHQDCLNPKRAKPERETV